MFLWLDGTYLSTGCILQFLLLCGFTKKILLLLGTRRSTGRELPLYVVKSSMGKKNVLILSILELILGTTKDDNCHKLELYKPYDFKKGGTDIVDQRMGFHTVETKSRKWTLVMFAYMLDTARVSSSTIFALNQGKDPVEGKHFEYTY